MKRVSYYAVVYPLDPKRVATTWHGDNDWWTVVGAFTPEECERIMDVNKDTPRTDTIKMK